MREENKKNVKSTSFVLDKPLYFLASPHGNSVKKINAMIF